MSLGSRTWELRTLQEVDEVFAWLEAFVGRLDGSAGYHSLLREALAQGREDSARSPLPAAFLPIATCRALGGERCHTLPVAGACTLLYLGADLLDDLADGELAPRWSACPTACVELVATILTGPAPHRAVLEASVEGLAPERVARIARALCEAQLRMTAGQYDDLATTTGPAPGPTDCRLVAERKAGAEFAFFTSAGAMCATDDAAALAGLAEFGACLGTAGQLSSDVDDLWGGATSQDLLNGVCTLPVAHALASSDPLVAQTAAGLRERSRTDRSVHNEMRQLLERSGSLAYVALVVEVYRRRALAGLGAARLSPQAREPLEELLHRVSLLPEGTGR